MKTLSAIVLSIGTLTFATQAHAEFELSLYTGYQTSPHSKVTGTDPTGDGDFAFTAGWKGHSFEMPPYYGIRGMFWTNSNWGFGADFTHSKAYADAETLGDSGTSGGFEVLEFTDGLNNLTLNAAYRWQKEGRKWTPYAGGGLGVIIPHVEVKSSATATETQSYQVAGPTAMLNAGISYAINPKWSAFGEYKGTYSKLSADLDGGGTFKTDIITNAFNIGISRKF
jgi:lipid A oxidase